MHFIGDFMPLIVGSIFFALGANLILHFYKFRARSKKFRGRVTAIEKYVSRTRTSQGQTSQLIFRPIVEFTHDGQTRTTFGPGMSEIRHKLGQGVTVLVNEDAHSGGIQTMLDDNMRVVMGAVFAAVGLGALAVYVFGIGGSPIIAIGVAGALSGAGYAVANILVNFTLPFTADDDAQPGADSTLITTPQQFREEVSSHGFWGAVIAWGLMLVSIALIAAGLYNMPEEALEMITDDFGGFWEMVTQGKVKSSWETPLIVTAIGLFLFLASLRSTYYIHKKYGALLSR